MPSIFKFFPGMINFILFRKVDRQALSSRKINKHIAILFRKVDKQALLLKMMGNVNGILQGKR